MANYCPDCPPSMIGKTFDATYRWNYSDYSLSFVWQDGGTWMSSDPTPIAFPYPIYLVKSTSPETWGVYFRYNGISYVFGGCNPAHTYHFNNGFQGDVTVPGTYTTTNVIVADFTPLNNAILIDLSVAFVDTSVSNLTINQWAWDFGDGNTSTDQNPIHQYATIGTFIASLTTWNTAAQHSIATHSIILSDIVSNFTPSAGNICVPISGITFTDMTVSSGSPIVSWAWDFGDGNTSTDQNPTHVYDLVWIAWGYDSYSYTVTLNATNLAGHSNSISNIITLSACGDILAEFTSGVMCWDGVSPITFTDKSSANYPITGWEWSLYGGPFSTDQNPIYTPSWWWNAENITLKVTDERGNQSSTTHTITLSDCGIVNAAFTPSTEISTWSQDSITFTDASFATYGISQWYWDFGDGSSSWGQNQTHSYINAGIYTVTLSIWDIYGKSDVAYNTVNITNPGELCLISSGTITNNPLISGTVYVYTSGYHVGIYPLRTLVSGIFTDDIEYGILSSITLPGSGTIDYNTGNWDITLFNNDNYRSCQWNTSAYHAAQPPICNFTYISIFPPITLGEQN